MTIPSVTVAEFAEEWRSEAKPFLLDVRETHEARFCKIEGSYLIPLGQLPLRLDELPRDCPLVVHCHHGGRSAQAVQYLKEQGFSDVRNLAGGIDAWSLQVDKELPRY